MSDSDPILDELRRIIGNRDCAGPTSHDALADAESQLGVQLPASFRMFLLHFGAGGLPAPYTLVGLPACRATDPEPPMWSHLLDVDAQLRRYGNHPRTLVPISSDGCGVNIFLDVSRIDAADECPVVARGPGVDDIDIAPTFLAFVDAAVFGDPMAVL